MKKYIVLVFLGLFSSVMYSQQNKALDEEVERFAQAMKREGEKLAKSRQRATTIALAVDAIQISGGLLLMYLNYYLYTHPKPLSPLAQRESEFAALEATEDQVNPVNAFGLLLTATGLWKLYYDLNLSEQVKKILKLLKQEKTEEKK